MKVKYTKCADCKGKFRVVHLWRNNHILGKGTKWLCEDCFGERMAQGANHLLQRYNRVMANRNDPKIYDLFEKTYDRSERDEQLIFLGLLGEGHGGKNVSL